MLQNHSILGWVACQFTGLMLRLTISLIFHSINNLKDNLDPANGSRT